MYVSHCGSSIGGCVTRSATRGSITPRVECYSVSRGQDAPLSVRLPGGLRARIDEAAEESGLSRNAWIVRVLEHALTDGAGPPPKPSASTSQGLGPKQVRVDSDGSRFWLVGVEGRVPGIEAMTEASVRRVAQREGYEVVGS